jgi:hypothetical protein
MAVTDELYGILYTNTNFVLKVIFDRSLSKIHLGLEGRAPETTRISVKFGIGDDTEKLLDEFNFGEYRSLGV